MRPHSYEGICGSFVGIAVLADDAVGILWCFRISSTSLSPGKSACYSGRTEMNSLTVAAPVTKVVGDLRFTCGKFPIRGMRRASTGVIIRSVVIVVNR